MKIRKIMAAIMAAMTSVAMAQQRTDILIWNENAPQEQARAAAESKDLDKDPTITVYKAAQPNGKAIVMCPGGGYTHLATAHEGHDMAPWMNSLGITYVVLKYRMPHGDSTVPLADAEQAMRIVRAHAAEWGIDPGKIGVMGASAGGHLASTLATHYGSKETRPDFQVLFYPVVSMDPAVTHMGSRDNLLGKNPSKELQDRFCNEKQVDKDTPKAFIMLSGDDGAVPPANSIGYFNALNANGIPVSLHLYPEGGHGWGFRDSFKYKRQWTGELEKWLREDI